MNRWQWVVFTIVMAQLAAVLVLFHRSEDDYATLGVVKYAVIASIFLASLLLPKPTLDHWPLAIAIADYLMFQSDHAVGFSFFYPGQHLNQPWLGTFIWVTYIPAWTLILVNLSESRLATTATTSVLICRRSPWD